MDITDPSENSRAGFREDVQNMVYKIEEEGSAEVEVENRWENEEWWRVSEGVGEVGEEDGSVVSELREMTWWPNGRERICLDEFRRGRC